MNTKFHLPNGIKVYYFKFISSPDVGVLPRLVLALCQARATISRCNLGLETEGSIMSAPINASIVNEDIVNVVAKNRRLLKCEIKYNPLRDMYVSNL